MQLPFAPVLLASLLAFATPAPLAPPAGERTTTLADQRAVSLTIYNADLALVHDERRLALATGANRIAWRDVTAKMDATSALFRSLAAPDAVSVTEQNFNFDLLTPETLLQKYVGRLVTVVHVNPKTGAQTRETARVLSTNGGVVLQYADRVETSIDGRIVYPAIPSNLRDRPTLVIDASSRLATPQELELTYLTGGLGWHADYVGQLSKNEDRLELDGLITLSNQSGATFTNAKLQLVAGDVNAPAPSPVALREFGRTAPANQNGVSQAALSEYHLYTLAHPTTIADNQTKQVAFLGAHAIAATKTLELRGTGEYYRTSQSDLGDRLKVGSYLTFRNAGGDLGVPLPAGTVRIYERDAAGTTQFVGADRIGHTPKNDTVRLYLGNSFDVTARKRQTNYTHVNATTDESGYEIVVGNAKTQPVSVKVVEIIPGDWSITAESARHVKSSSTTATWSLTVPADGSTTLTYTARVRY